jgi:hypothetical protein
MLARLNHPEELTNDMIQDIGKKYIAEHGEEAKGSCFGGLFSHQNRPAAKKLRDYNQEATCKARWIFLADIYQNLSGEGGKIGAAIRNLFEAAFQVKITTEDPYDSDEDVSNHDILQNMQHILNEYFLKQAGQRLGN